MRGKVCLQRLHERLWAIGKPRQLTKAAKSGKLQGKSKEKLWSQETVPLIMTIFCDFSCSYGKSRFMEVGPENWIDVGGLIGHKFSAIAEQIPLVCHGLSLNLCPIDLPPKERLKLLLCLQSLKLSFHMTVNFRTIFLVFLNNANGYP